MRRLLGFGVLLISLWQASAAHAQLESTSPAHQRAANRRALREARQVKAEYKESHLTVTKVEVTPGKGGRQAVRKPTDGRQNYQFDRTGTPRVSEPSRIGLRLRKKRPASTPKS
ncbi:hypothetical protein [Hymenobacter weizhouensis]|uniref:hypothetical protein n=1 Tax=Hymenobacter sp. YIM 151500-1 TaxID=2987689 RepID=UPI0022266EC7|nr:hypothetical protein [Hymenobacter sp. YIM 151500-1]UYZ62575.1 hypothetical protein OIS53_16435 [Hymenobacter sp. YIM 151500-1]